MAATFVRVFSETAGRAALKRVLPLYVGVGVAAAVIFGPQGMTAADAVGAFGASRPVGLGFWSAWLLATAPAARTLFEAPGAFYLRALPVARWRFHALHAAHLLLLEVPWVVLHLRGGGLGVGAAAASVTVGAHALLCATPRLGWREVGAAALLLVSMLARRAEIAAGVLAAAVAIPAAFRRAPERAALARRRTVRGPRVIALALVHLTAVRRRAPQTIGRAILCVGAGVLTTVLATRNNTLEAASSRSALSLGVLGAFLVVGLGGIQQTIVAAEASARWLLDATGTSRRARVAAGAGAAALCGAILGLVHGTAVAVALATDPRLGMRLAVLGLVWGAAIATLGAAGARRAARVPEKHRGSAAVVSSAVVAVAGGAACALLGEAAALAALPAAFVVSALESEAR